MFFEVDDRIITKHCTHDCRLLQVDQRNDTTLAAPQRPSPSLLKPAELAPPPSHPLASECNKQAIQILTSFLHLGNAVLDFQIAGKICSFASPVAVKKGPFVAPKGAIEE